MEFLRLFLGLYKGTTLLGDVAKCWLFSVANVFVFYFQLTNAAGYTAVYITVNVSYINLMFFMCLRCSVTYHILLLLSLLFPLISCHSPVLDPLIVLFSGMPLRAGSQLISLGNFECADE